MEDKKDTYKHGFKVPEDYFEKMEDRVFDALDIKELPEQSGFGVPEGYFDTLEDEILQKVKVAPKETKVIPIGRKRSFWYAASIAACIAFVFAFFNPWIGEGSTTNPEEPSLAEIEAYIEEGIGSIDSYDLAQVLTDADLDALELETEYLSDESLEEYLLDNIDDPTIFIE
ncbi:MAG: hypothetical protein Aureis2KO_14460 [Aureisphaera sp.]